MKTKTKPVGIGDTAVVAGNGGQPEELFGQEYAVEVEIVGRTPFLFHAWDSAAVAEKGAAAKGSQQKREDNVESYVYRDAKRNLGVPAAMIGSCLANAARSLQDPRSPRKSLFDLARASLRVEPFLITFEPKTEAWDYLDRRRVVVQRSAVTRTRPALREGWRLQFEIDVLAGEYIRESLLHDLLSRAGRFNGIGDFRPLFGLFRVDAFKRIALK